MADAVKACGQDVEQETANECVGGKRHGLLLVAGRTTIILVGKCDASIIDGEDALVGDGHAVRIARQISQNRLWPRKGSLGINNLLLGTHGRDKVRKMTMLRQVGLITKEAQLSVTVKGHELGQE